MNKTRICLSNGIGFAANGERNGVVDRHSGLTLVEAQKLQCLCGKVNIETLLGGSGGEMEIGEVSGGDAGNGGIVVIKRGVENCRINTVERRVWGSEKIACRNS